MLLMSLVLSHNIYTHAQGFSWSCPSWGSFGNSNNQVLYFVKIYPDRHGELWYIDKLGANQTAYRFEMPEGTHDVSLKISPDGIHLAILFTYAYIDPSLDRREVILNVISLQTLTEQSYQVEIPLKDIITSSEIPYSNYWHWWDEGRIAYATRSGQIIVNLETTEISMTVQLPFKRDNNKRLISETTSRFLAYGSDNNQHLTVIDSIGQLPIQELTFDGLKYLSLDADSSRLATVTSYNNLWLVDLISRKSQITRIDRWSEFTFRGDILASKDLKSAIWHTYGLDGSVYILNVPTESSFSVDLKPLCLYGRRDIYSGTSSWSDDGLYQFSMYLDDGQQYWLLYNPLTHTLLKIFSPEQLARLRDDQIIFRIAGWGILQK